MTDKREIKFRAWDIDNDKMIQSYAHIGKNGNMFVSFTERPQKLYIMQYTGLKDKNGNEIYEGDILQYINTFHHIRIVERQNNKSRFSIRRIPYLETYKENNRMPKQKTLSKRREVIGNIYENPELLSSNNPQGQTKER